MIGHEEKLQWPVLVVITLFTVIKIPYLAHHLGPLIISTILLLLLLHASHITYAQYTYLTYAHQHSVQNMKHEDTKDMCARPSRHDVTCAQDIQDMCDMCPKTKNQFLQ